MPLTAQQAFRAGFLLRCAHEGLAPADVESRIAAAGDFAKQATLASTLSGAVAFPLVAGLVGGGAIGAGLGAATASHDLGKLPRPEYLDEVQRSELAETYRQQTDMVRRQIALAKRRMAMVGPKRSPYGI